MSADNSTDAHLAESTVKSLTINADQNATQTHLTTVVIEQTWIIDRFSSYVDAEDEFPWLYSAPFSLGHGHPNFRLVMFPNGKVDKEDKGFVALFLECTAKPPAELSVNFQFSIIDKDGQHRKTRGPIDHTFTKNDDWGYSMFIARDYLLDPKNGLLAMNDQLKIYCKIKASFKKCTSRLSSRSYDDLEKFSLNMAKLLDNGQHSDVIISLGGTNIPAHKAILSAASSVFARMFEHKDTKEAQEGKVIVEDVDVDTFKVLLKYLYSRQIPDQAQLTEELLAASNRYLVDDLKMACEEHLSTTLTVDSAATMLLFADTHNASTLRSNCFHYITANPTKVMATEGWKEMVKARPELVDASFRQYVMQTNEL